MNEENESTDACLPLRTPEQKASLRVLEEDTVSEDSGYTLVFLATQSQPDFAALFLASGGSINAAAASGATDFSLTGSSFGTKTSLDTDRPTEVRIELPKSMFKKTETGVEISNRAKLNAKTMRVGATISGTCANAHAGDGSVYLPNLLGDTPHFQLPLIYGVLASHSATLGLSKIRIEDSKGDAVAVHFTTDEFMEKTLEEAEAVVEKKAHEAWALREKVVYDLSPSLTKTVAKSKGC